MWFDPEPVRVAGELAPEWLVLVLALLSFLGSIVVIAPVAVAAYWTGDRERTAPWLAAMVAIYGAMTLTKSLVALSRPPVAPPVDPATLPLVVRPAYVHAAEIDTASFPSGHVLAAVVFWTLVALDSELGSARTRLAAAGSVVTVVAASRIVLGAHYLGDLAGGLVVGLALLAGVLAIRSRAREPVPALLIAAGVLAAGGVVAGSGQAAAVVGASVGALAAWRATDGGVRLREEFRPRTHRGIATLAGAFVLTGVGVAGVALVVHPLTLAVAGAVGTALVVAAPALVRDATG